MEAFGWYKETLIFLKGNKVFLLLVTTALAGTGTQTFRLDTAEKDNIKNIREVATAFQSAMVDMEKPEIKRVERVIVKSNCDKCNAIMENHLRNLHE